MSAPPLEKILYPPLVHTLKYTSLPNKPTNLRLHLRLFANIITPRLLFANSNNYTQIRANIR